MTEAGLSPAEALLTVTKNAATFYRIADKLGSVEAGKIADILILSANPLDNIRNSRSIEHVIKEGRIVDASFDPNFVNPIPRPDPERTGHLFPSPVIGSVSPRMVRQRNDMDWVRSFTDGDDILVAYGPADLTVKGHIGIGGFFG